MKKGQASGRLNKNYYLLIQELIMMNQAMKMNKIIKKIKKQEISIII